MSIAWGSLVLLILLLPGVLFFTGIYLPEQFTREAEVRTPLGQLAVTLLVAFVVHGLLYSFNLSVCGSRIPCVNVQSLLGTLAPDSAPASRHRATAAMLERYHWSIFLYMLTAAASGLGLGAVYGWLVSKKRFHRFSKHPWVYDLRIDGFTYAYVLTNVRQDERILMYKGFLRAFGLQQDGRFSYLVLITPARLYLNMAPDSAYTSDPASQRLIGEQSEGAIMGPAELTRHRTRERSYLVIKGDEVANVVFDRLGLDKAAVARDEFRRIVVQAAKGLGYTLTAEEAKAAGVDPPVTPPAPAPAIPPPDPPPPTRRRAPKRPKDAE